MTFPLLHTLIIRVKKVKQSLSGLKWPRVFQEIKVPISLDTGTGRW
jgi:hypothetical protein